MASHGVSMCPGCWKAAFFPFSPLSELLFLDEAAAVPLGWRCMPGLEPAACVELLWSTRLGLS